ALPRCEESRKPSGPICITVRLIPDKCSSGTIFEELKGVRNHVDSDGIQSREDDAPAPGASEEGSPLLVEPHLHAGAEAAQAGVGVPGVHGALSQSCTAPIPPNRFLVGLAVPSCTWITTSTAWEYRGPPYALPSAFVCEITIQLLPARTETSCSG